MFVDMLQSLVLIVISLIIQNHPETAYLDPIFSFFMSFTAAVVNLPVITNCISILLIEPPVLDAIKSKIEKLNEVALVSDIYIIQRSGGDEVLNV
jgi:Co/Zn/Cd efflux system component